MYGGGQENGMRSGTENLPGICAFAAAAKEISENMAEKLEKAAKMREILLNALGAIRACKVAEAAEQSPYIINAAFPGLRAEVILHTLETYGIYVSVGSACSSHKKGRSQVLTAMGYDTKTIDGAIRISLSPQNTEAQCEYAGGVIVREIKKLYVLHTVRKGRH